MCNKIKYPTRQLATRAMWYFISLPQKGRKKPCRVYRCQVCGGYHLTHRPEQGLSAKELAYNAK